jgi:hypothetical protein
MPRGACRSYFSPSTSPAISAAASSSFCAASPCLSNGTWLYARLKRDDNRRVTQPLAHHLDVDALAQQ